MEKHSFHKYFLALYFFFLGGGGGGGGQIIASFTCDLSRLSTLYKVIRKTFIKCFEHAECIEIDIFDVSFAWFRT